MLNEPKMEAINQNEATRIENYFSENTEVKEMLKEKPITLVDLTFERTFENTRNLAPNRQVVFCDAPINELINNGEALTTGYKKENVINIDHHFTDPRFYRYISSGNLAIEQVKQTGCVNADALVVINHTDCDAVLSSSIIRGILKPHDDFGRAAIAADHTGEANAIADLLQACEDERSIEFSLSNLKTLLENRALTDKASELLEKYLNKRRIAIEIARQARFTDDKRIAYMDTDTSTKSAFFPALLPEAEYIIITCQRSHKDANGKRLPGKQAKVRLGLKAKPGTNVSEIVKKFDPNFGGRWNAGSNDRSIEGMQFSLEDYVKLFSENI